jgi:hypothetical protein
MSSKGNIGEEEAEEDNDRFSSLVGSKRYNVDDKNEFKEVVEEEDNNNDDDRN